MRSLLSTIRQFLSELRRRNVYQVAVTYVVVGFFVIEAADLTLTRLGLPPWTVTFVVVLVGLGFPLALVMAWALEVTPEGVQVEEPEGAEEGVPAPASTTRDLWVGASVLALLLLAGGGLWYMNAESEASATESPRLAVLPFENIAPDSSNAFFARGLHEEVLNQLEKVSGLEVISRTSVKGYANTNKQVPQISQDLGGVSALLEGTVRRVGDQVRITTQLIEAPEDEHLWSEMYDRRLEVDELFQIQTDIAKKVAGALQTELTDAEASRIREAPTTSLNAYDAYLKGRNASMTVWNELDPTRVSAAIRHLRDAVRYDSTFAEAHAWLGFAYKTRTHFSGEAQWADSALAAVNRARALAPELPDVHSIRGFVYQGDSTAAAEAAYRRALQLAPNNRLAADGMADLAAYEGNYAEAIKWAHRVVRADPRWEYGLMFMGALLQWIGMDDVAASWFHQVREMNPENVRVVQLLTDLYLSQGKMRNARETVASYRSSRPDHPMGIRLAAKVALHQGRPKEAKRLLQKTEPQRELDGRDVSGLPSVRLPLGLAELRSGNHETGRRLLQAGVDSSRARFDEKRDGLLDTDLLGLARGLSALGHSKEALEYLRVAMERGEIRHRLLREDPFFENLRSNPRFRELLAQMETRREEFQKKVREMNIDLYPPGAMTDADRSPSTRQ